MGVNALHPRHKAEGGGHHPRGPSGRPTPLPGGGSPGGLARAHKGVVRKIAPPKEGGLGHMTSGKPRQLVLRANLAKACFLTVAGAWV